MPRSHEKLVSLPPEPRHGRLEKSFLILSHAHDAASDLLNVFDQTRKTRRATGGQTTDEEQNLLRAMLVFAGAGLDSMAKQVVRDSLPVLVKKNKEAKAAFASFVARRLRDEAVAAATSSKGFEFLAAGLVAPVPLLAFTKAYVEHLTGNSLQSSNELASVVAALGLSPAALTIDLKALTEVFKARNKIVHEMDVDFAQKNRKRFARRRGEMIKWTNLLLAACSIILSSVDEQLAE